mgnify:CR=1 FL=1
MINVEIKQLAHGANLPLPAYETPGAAGMDLRAAEECILKPGAALTERIAAIDCPAASLRRMMSA